MFGKNGIITKKVHCICFSFDTFYGLSLLMVHDKQKIMFMSFDTTYTRLNLKQARQQTWYMYSQSRAICLWGL